MSTTRRQQTAPGRHSTFRRRASFGAPVVLVLVAGAWGANETALAPSGADETSPTTVTYSLANPPQQVLLEAEGSRHVGEPSATVDSVTTSTTSGSPPAEPASRTAPSAGSSTQTVNPPPPAAPVEMPPLANPPAPAPDPPPPSLVISNPPAPPADPPPPSQVIANPPALVSVSISSAQP